MTDPEAEARAYLGPKQAGIPQVDYDRAVARLVFVTRQWRRGLRLRDGRWKRIKEGSEVSK